MACRRDRQAHVLYLKECRREGCGKPFLHCGCESGRRYCGEECSREARRESIREARREERKTAEGRAQHAAEEKARRQRQRDRRQQAGLGSREAAEARDDAGGLALPVTGGGVPVAIETGSTFRSAKVRAPADGEGPGRTDSAARQTDRVGDQRCAGGADEAEERSLTGSPAGMEVSDGLWVLGQASMSDKERGEPVEWLLVAEPELLPQAKRLVGTTASCPFCGKRGRIGGLASTEQWRRWIRYGRAPLA